MRSLIILEVIHGEDTDAFQAMAEELADKAILGAGRTYAYVRDYTVKVDIPECFSL